MRVLGIDPGSSATGYGVVEGDHGTFRLLECGVVRPRAAGTFAERLLQIHEGVLSVIDLHEPDCLAIEGVFYRENARTAVILSHARGVAAITSGRIAGWGILPVSLFIPAETTAVRCQGRSASAQCKMITRPGFSSPNQPDQARIMVYRTSIRQDLRSNAQCATFVGDWEEPSGGFRLIGLRDMKAAVACACGRPARAG